MPTTKPRLHLTFEQANHDALMERTPGEREPGAVGVSLAANKIVARYLVLIKEGKQLADAALSPAEWNLLRAITNGTLFITATDHHMLCAEVDDADDEYFKEWKVDRRKLLKNLGELPSHALMAIVEELERYWRQR